jgi:hypothetical protein
VDGELFSDEIGRKTQDVQIEVPPASLDREIVMARSSTDSLILVRRHGHSQASSAQEDPPVDLLTAYLLSHETGNVRVINRVAFGGPKVLDFMAKLSEQFDHPRPKRTPAVVRTHCNSHFTVAQRAVYRTGRFSSHAAEAGKL